MRTAGLVLCSALFVFAEESASVVRSLAQDESSNRFWVLLQAFTAIAIIVTVISFARLMQPIFNSNAVRIPPSQPYQPV